LDGAIPPEIIMKSNKSDWLIPAGLIALSLVPAVAGIGVAFREALPVAPASESHSLRLNWAKTWSSATRLMRVSQGRSSV
jgi:hypothetical protein